MITPREYLEAALRLAPGDGAAVQSKNQARHPLYPVYPWPRFRLTRDMRTPQIRRSIASLFPSRDCFALVRPVNDEKQLQNLDGALRKPSLVFVLCALQNTQACANALYFIATSQRCLVLRCAPSSPPAWTR